MHVRATTATAPATASATATGTRIATATAIAETVAAAAATVTAKVDDDCTSNDTTLLLNCRQAVERNQNYCSNKPDVRKQIASYSMTACDDIWSIGSRSITHGYFAFAYVCADVTGGSSMLRGDVGCTCHN